MIVAKFLDCRRSSLVRADMYREILWGFITAFNNGWGRSVFTGGGTLRDIHQTFKFPNANGGVFFGTEMHAAAVVQKIIHIDKRRAPVIRYECFLGGADGFQERRSLVNRNIDMRSADGDG